jgi:hypothetical protein
MVEYVATHQQTLQAGYSVLIVPVIFTTATLWTSDVDLSAADLRTGNVAPDVGSLTSQPWLWVNYNQSPALKHSLATQADFGHMEDALEIEYTRSIAIVNAQGIEDFFQHCEFYK